MKSETWIPLRWVAILYKTYFDNLKTSRRAVGTLGRGTVSYWLRPREVKILNNDVIVNVRLCSGIRPVCRFHSDSI